MGSNKILAQLNRILVVTMIFILSGCTISYKLNGGVIDYNQTKTISIAEFPIRAALVYAPLQQTFDLKLRNLFTQQTRLKLVDNNGDLQMEGEITGYNLTPQAVTEDAYASQTRLTITVHVKYTNTKESQYDLDQSFSAYRDFSSSELLVDVQDNLIEQICDELADLIFNATVGNW